MEAEGRIAETLCEVAEELPWHKLLQRARGGVGATQTGEGRMEGFNETDAANLQRVKDAMAERAVGGGGVLGQPDAAAAAAFAALLDAETRREELPEIGGGRGRPRPLRPLTVGRKASPADSRSRCWPRSFSRLGLGHGSAPMGVMVTDSITAMPRVGGS